MPATANRTNDPDALAVLWEPLEIGPATVRNRIGHAPFTTLWATDQVLTERHLAYYEERARGGLGLIIGEQQAADRERISFLRNGCSALDPRCVEVYKELAERVHRQGGTQFLQLFGPGILDSVGLDLEGWAPIWGAGRIPSSGFGDQPLPVPIEQIPEIAANFGRAAANVEAGGLDGVELHGARSELIGQFLSPLYNRRDDAYGGSPEARCRFALEIAESVRQSAPKVAVGIQISVDEYMGDAATTEDVAAEQLGILAASGLFDFVDLSTGNEFTDFLTIPPMELGEIPTAKFGPRAKSIVGDDVKVMINGGVHDVATAARLVSDGVADIVLMSRPSFADAEIVNKARSGRVEEIRPCLGHNDCLHAAHKGRPVACQMNPAAGRESRWGITVPRETARKRRVVVAGGGPAGMQAAIAAAQNGHDVALFERSDTLGGHMALLARLPGRARWRDGVDWFAAELERSGVDVHLGTELSAGSEALAGTDTFIAATGARWSRTGFSPVNPTLDRLPGVEQENVIDADAAAEAALADPRSLGGRVVILDESGEYLPLGVADALSSGGTEVTIVTRHPGVGLHVAFSLDHGAVFKRLAAQNVEMRSVRMVTAIDGDRVAITELWNSSDDDIEGVDTVVLSLTREPCDELYREVSATVADARLIGDALVPRRTAAVIAEGQSVGFEL